MTESVTTNIDFDKLDKALYQLIDGLEQDTLVTESGYVHTVADGIASVKGLANACLDEVIEFPGGIIGVVRELLPYETKVVLFNRFEEVKSGALAKRTCEELRIPVGDAVIGRVIDVFGNPIDGMGEIRGETKLMPIERQAPKLVDRSPVSKPLTTGIIAIDSMIPIGLGQRELILGDMQTGKTSIAIGTILNQLARYKAGNPIYCFYVAIGQKMDSIVEVYEQLKAGGAMQYTTIIAASASDSAHSQFIAPYAGSTLAEHFMDAGKNCLIIYDDLSKHAVAHREISRLLGRPAGRDAYPADSFYIHARLLERSANLQNGGSITALPIIETQDGDISGYIATNVISITDGQIFLDSRMLDRPKIDVGESVSRTGSAAQASATKKVSRSMKSELAQYSELAKFAQFTSGNLDKVQMKILQKGQQTKHLLSQDEDERYTLEEEAILIAGSHYGIFAQIKNDKKQVRSIKKAFLAAVESGYPQIFKEIRTTNDITDSSLEVLKQIASKFEMEEDKTK